MGRTRQRSAPSLTPELWAKVFGHLEASPELATSWDEMLSTENQAETHQLKLVCRQFRKIFASHTGLVQRLYLSYDFSVSSLPGLLAWLQQSKGSVQMFTANCEGQRVYTVLAGLVASQPNMRYVSCHLDVFSIPLMAAFTSLEKCNIWHPEPQHLDLAPLGSLPRDIMWSCKESSSSFTT